MKDLNNIVVLVLCTVTDVTVFCEHFYVAPMWNFPVNVSYLQLYSISEF